MATNVLGRIALRSLWMKHFYARSMHTTSLLLMSADKADTKAPPPEGAAPKTLIGSHYKPTPFERKLLIWTRRYPLDSDIPKYVPHDQMERARNLFRIYGMVAMMIITLVACIGMIQSGKRAYERGESLTKMNVEWHKRAKETNEK